MDAMVVRGLSSAVVGTGVAGTGDATWVQVGDAEETNHDADKAKRLAREYRGTVENIAEQFGLPQIAQMVRCIRDRIAPAGVTT